MKESRIIIKNGIYYCTNCHKQVCPVTPKCASCEYWFSNYEDIWLGNHKEALEEGEKTEW